MSQLECNELAVKHTEQVAQWARMAKDARVNLGTPEVQLRAAINREAAAGPGASQTQSTLTVSQHNIREEEARRCKICYNAELSMVFLPCRHMVACDKCAMSLTHCPVCRQQFTHTIRAFIP